MSPSSRGFAYPTTWGAFCKNCVREGHGGEFRYPHEWVTDVTDRGGSRSDRCPACREKHGKAIRALSAPYVDLAAIGQVANPAWPTGPLGGLGPLPIEHVSATASSDLEPYGFGLTDSHIVRLLTALAEPDCRVAILEAGTGSGKSTFAPFRLLYPPPGAPLRLASRGPIIVTEPRKAAAIDTATFVGTKLARGGVGPGNAVGYRVQDAPMFDSACRLLYVTDGSLINWLRDGRLSRYGAIIIDEAHERSSNIDFILGLLRRALPTHPDLRVIIASATVDANFFTAFYSPVTRVHHEVVQAEKAIGYGEPLWPGEDIAVGIPPYDRSDWNQVVDGEDLRAATRQYAALRIGAAPPPSKIGPYKSDMPRRVTAQVLSILRGTPTGDVLAFLPHRGAIEEAVTGIEKQASDVGLDVDVYPLLRTTPEAVQRAARGERPAGSKRRVVVSTNIAETSLTIDGIRFVVDSGLICQSAWDAEAVTSTVPTVWHSQQGLRQRWGRVGRKAPGWVFPLYSRKQFTELFPAFTPPEASRANLENFVLTAAACGVEDMEDFPWPAGAPRLGEPEDAEAPRSLDSSAQSFVAELRRAVASLKTRGVLDRDGHLTRLGRELQGGTMSLDHATALAYSDHLACLPEMLTVLLMLGGGRSLAGSVLWFPHDKTSAHNSHKAKSWSSTVRWTAARHHRAWRAGCRDDLDLALMIYAAWERDDAPADWAARHWIDHKALLTVRDQRRDAFRSLAPGMSKTKIRPIRTELAPRVRAALNRAFADLVYERTGAGWRSLQQPSAELAELDPRAFVAGGPARMIALHRNTWGDPTLLSNLVAVTDLPQIATSAAGGAPAARAGAGVEASPGSRSTGADTAYPAGSGPEPAAVDEVLGAAAGWLDVAVAAAEQLRTAEGSVVGVPLEGHISLREEWPVGARLRVEVVAAAGDRLSLRAVAVLAPIAVHPLHVDPAAVGDYEDGLLEDEQTAENSPGEVVALATTDTLPVPEIDTAEYVELESIEVNDEEDAGDSADARDPADDADLSLLLSADFHSDSEELLSAAYSTSTAAGDLPPAVRSPMMVRPPVSVALPQTEVLAQFGRPRLEGPPAVGAVLPVDVVGYIGLGAGRVVMVEDAPNAEAGKLQISEHADAVSPMLTTGPKSRRRRSYDLSAQERIVVLDTLVGWGASAALVAANGSRHAVVDAAELDLSGQDHDICALLSPGEVLTACPTVREDRPTFSLRPRLAADLLGRPRTRVGSREFFVATLTNVAVDRSFAIATLDGGRPEPGLSHRFRLRRYLLDKAAVVAEVGTRVGLSLATDEDRAKVRLPDPPAGLADLCARWQGRLRYDDENLQVLRRQPLPDRLTTSLLELDDDPDWSRLVWRLWESRVPTRVMSVQALAADAEVLTSRPGARERDETAGGRRGSASRSRERGTRPPEPGRHEAKVREVQDKALRVDIAGWVGTLPAHQIGPEGLTDLGRWMPIGAAVTVTATLNTGGSGPPIRLSAKDHPLPSLFDQLTALVGSTSKGPVVGETGGGVFVQLFPGLRQVRAYLPKAELDNDAGRLLAEQAEVTVRITHARVDRGRLQVRATLDLST